MSEGDVSLIQDEDVLRKMWQQTEDMSKRKEIRAHMYKLREERLKTLYADPSQTDGKSLQFTSSGGHTDSFADQCFQSLKSKEVRDSESPTRDYNFKLQDAENSAGGWTVVSSNEKSDDGKTQIKTTSAHTSGTYDADGGTTSYSGLNESQKKVTKHEDDNSKYFSSENASNTMTKEQFVSDADDEKVTRSSTSTVGSSRVQSSYSHKYDSNTDKTQDDTDFISAMDSKNVLRSSSELKNEKRSETTSSNIVTSSDGAALIIDGTVVKLGDGELVSRKVEHPDEFTKVVTETRKLADGTTVTSTSREIKGSYTSKSGKQSSEHFDSATSKSTSTSERSSSKALKSHVDNETNVIVSEDITEKKISTLCGDECHNNYRNKTSSDNNLSNQGSVNVISSNNVNTEFIESEKIQDVTSNVDRITNVASKTIEETNTKSDAKFTSDQSVDNVCVNSKTSKIEEFNDFGTKTVDKSILGTHTDEIIEVDRSILNTEYPKPEVPEDAGDIIHNRKTTGEYTTTYQTDYTTKKISEDLSPTHNAWASSLRSSSDSPLHGGSPSRGSIRGSRTSVSSLRSSISPDKRSDRDYPKKKNEREPSPKKTNSSPTRISSENIYNKTGKRKSIDETIISRDVEEIDDKYNRNYTNSKKSETTVKTSTTITKDKKSNKKYEISTDSKNEEVCSLIDLKTDSDKKFSSAGNPYSSPRKNPGKNEYSPYTSPTRSPVRKNSSPTRSSPTKSSPQKNASKESPATSPTRASPSKPYTSKQSFDKSPSMSPTRTPHKVSKYSPHSSNSSSPTRSMSPNKSYNEPTRSLSPNKSYNKSKDSNYQPKNVLRSRDSSPTTSVSEIEFISGIEENVNKTGTFTKKESTRKSSLKKSSIQNTDDIISVDSTSLNDIKKDDTTTKDTKAKVKPPFVRSETYEERCRKILGMPDKKTLVEGAEKNLSEILGILPSDKISDKNEKYTDRTSTERELTTGIKSAELIRKPSDSEIPIYRKSSLKKSTDTQNQLKNLTDAEFINLDTHGNVVSCDTTPNCNITDESTLNKSSKITSEQFIKNELNETSNQRLKNVKKVEELIDKNIDIETLSTNKNDSTIERNVMEKEREVTSPTKNIVNNKTTSPKKSSPQKTLSPERVPTHKPSTLRTPSPDKKTTSCDRTLSPEKTISQKAPTKKPIVSKESPEKHVTKQVNEESKTTKTKTVTNDTTSVSKKHEPTRSILTSQKYNIFKDDKSTRKSDDQPKTKDVTSKKQISSQKVSDTKLLFNRKLDNKSKTTLQNVNDDKQSIDTKKKTVELRKKFTDDSKPKDVSVHKMQRSLTDARTTTCITHNTDIKMTRTASDIVMKPSRAEPTRVKSKPEINITKTSPVKNTTYKPSPTTNKTTNPKSNLGLKPTTPKSKTPISNNTIGGNVIVDLQRAKSSRESSPDHICPLPVYSSSDNEKPRLPDKVTEPDDVVNKKKIMHQTISETDTFTESNIVEVSDDEYEVSKRHDLSQSDECLLSVTEKVSKFSNVDDNKETTTKNDVKKSHKKTITDKVEEKLTSDDCLLSVFDKVSKFSNVSDTKKVDDNKQRVTEDFIRHEVGSDLENDECLLSVNNKVSHFIKTAEKVTEPIKLSDSGPRSKKPDVVNNRTQKNESIEKSPGLVSKVSKMISDVKHVFDNDTTTVNDIKLHVQKETVASQAKKTSTDNKYVHIKSQITPERTVSKSSPEKVMHVKSHITPERTLPKTTSTPEKIHPSPILKSTDTVKKAKALFENIANQTTETQDLSHKRSTKLTDIGVYKKSPTLDSVPDVVPKKEVNDYSFNIDTKSTKNKNVDATENYSTHTNTTTKYSTTSRTNEVVKDNETFTDECYVSTRRGSGKFGVELRRTSTDQAYNSERRRSSTLEPHLQPTIEDINDLMLLEQMLEKVTGYEQRRRIRTQIRVVKRNLENKPSCSPAKSASREISPTRRNKSTIVYEKTSSPVSIKKTSSVSVTDTSMRSVSPDKKSKTYSPDRNRSTSPSKKSHKIDTINSNVKIEKKTETNKTFDLEDHEHLSSPLRTKTSKVSEYTTAYLRRIGASNNLKSEYLPKVPNIRRDKEEMIDDHHSSCTRKTSSVTEKTTIVTSKRNDTESRHTTRSPSPKHSQSPTERIYVRTPSPDLKKPRQNELKETTEYHSAYSNLKTKTPPKETTNKMKQNDDDKPVWVKSNILRKTSTETKTYSHKKTDDKSKTIRRAHSPAKNVRKPTDVITSSYGVGPTDENGKPLFGIKALRKSSNSSTNYEVKGTVITRQFRSENGGEPAGHVTLTAYSTDPADLKNIIDNSNNCDSKTAAILNKAVQDKSRKGISSITTTTRYGGTTGNPISKIHKTNQTRAIEGVPSSDHTTRRGSVKSLTEKFIKNAAETSKVEKSTYPKAGLILRTTSFRDNASGSISSRSSTPGVVRTDSNNSMNSTEMCSTTVERRKHSGTHTSFLDNRTKVTGVQDIITRMKNADIVIDDGDTAEDAEARSLLNKFLGATALMHGMSGYIDEKSQTKQFKQESRTVVSKTSTVLPDVEDIWDERILRKLLEESDDYEERRKIRARLRQVMAEQEACAQIVADAVEESAGEPVELQQQHQQDDGESLLGDGLASLPEPLLRDVHGALSRLQGALRTGPAPEPRDGALLELVARLQAGLLAQDPAPPRGSRRRRLGNTRHTVGVTREELADARKYMQNIAFPADNAAKQVEPEAPRSSPYALLKQASFGSVLSPTSFERTNSVPQTPVKNATARPFTLNFQSAKSADLPSPVDVLAKLPRSPLQESIRLNKPDDTLSYFEAAQVHQKQLPVKQTATVDPGQLQNGYSTPKPILKESVSLDSGSDHSVNETVAKIVHETLVKAAQKKICDYESSSESDDEFSDCSTVKMDERNNESDSVDPERTTPIIENNRISQYYIPKKPADNFIKQYNPIQKSIHPTHEPPKNNFVENYSVNNKNNMNGYREPENKITSKQNKKLKMKRANTIDIPKPAHHYQMESDDDSDNKHGLSKYYPLDTTNTEYKPKIPQFQPKTDNDRKFLAFIQKHDDDTAGRTQNSFNGQQQRNGGCNWKSCFGSIKNVFESSTSDNANKPLDINSRSASVTSAKNFWKTSDDPFHYSKPQNITSSKPVKMITNRPVEQSKYQPKLPWTSEAKGEVVTGSLTVSAPKMTNGVNDKVIKFIPKPVPVNQFSHAPMSAFKPLPKKSVPINTKVWSPPSVINNKPLESIHKKRDDEDRNILSKPPIQKAPIVSTTPWISNGSRENRVLNLAANKFGKSSPVTVSPQSPNIPPYREKSFNPLPIQNGHAEKRLSLPQSLPAPGPLSAPNLVRKLENLKQQMTEKIDDEEITPSKIDAERLQIEFYEKQIRENNRKYPKSTSNAIAARRFSEHIPENYTYTVTDFTPSLPVSTFVPVTEKSNEDDGKLESPKKVIDVYKPIIQKPDIENTKLQPSKKLPDVVLNNKDEYSPSKISPVTPEKTDPDDSHLYNKVNKDSNSEVHLNNTDNVKPSDSLQQTEYKAVAKVMKGPVSQQAVIKTKSTQETYEKRDSAAKSLKGVLQKFSSPKLDVIKQMEKKKAFMQDTPPPAKPSQPEPKAIVQKAAPRDKSAYEHSQNHMQNENISTIETTTTKKISKVSSEETVTKAAKTVSPFAKFRQLDKQNSIQSTPSSPKTPLTPTGGGSPLFKFTDPQLQTSATLIKERLLQWCRDKTQEYENVKLDNFSTSWSDGLAFCALIHHFLPDEYDYTKLVAQQRRHNFTLAFKVADEKAGIYPLLDVEDMVTMRKPDWKCVFTYVQAIHRRFKDQD